MSTDLHHKCFRRFASGDPVELSNAVTPLRSVKLMRSVTRLFLVGAYLPPTNTGLSAPRSSDGEVSRRHSACRAILPPKKMLALPLLLPRVAWRAETGKGDP